MLLACCETGAVETFTGGAVEGVPGGFLGRAAAFGGSGPPSPVEEEGNLLLQADCVSIEVRVFDLGTTPPTLIGTIQPSVGTAIVDELQTAGVWKKVKKGGNFRFRVPPELFPNGDITVQVESLILVTDGSFVPGIWKFSVTNLYSL